MCSVRPGVSVGSAEVRPPDVHRWGGAIDGPGEFGGVWWAVYGRLSPESSTAVRHGSFSRVLLYPSEKWLGWQWRKEGGSIMVVAVGIACRRAAGEARLQGVRDSRREPLEWVLKGVA